MSYPLLGRPRVPTLHAYLGAPASGKTSHANRRVLDHRPGEAIRVNRDDIRRMGHGGVWAGKATEPQIVSARDLMVEDALRRGTDVYVDDTNIQPIHLKTLQHLAFETGSDFEVIDFSHVDVEECVARDKVRPAPVGEPTIRKFATQLAGFKAEGAYATRPLPPVTAAPALDPALPSVVLVDLDGTLAIITGRTPMQFHLVSQDLPNPPVVAVVRSLLAAGVKVIAFSGREDVCRDDTRAWIDTHVGPGIDLYMRAAGDTRRDSVVKHEMFHQHIAGRYNVTTVFDDRNQVVRIWRTMGLPCFQVALGQF